MKTLIITYHFPPCTDGAATLMHNLCKYLPKECYYVITAREELGIHSWNNLGVYDREYILDCRTIRLPVRTKKLRDRIKFFLLMILEGILLNRKGEVDCLLAVYPDEFDLFGGYVLRQLTGKPLIIYMHDLYSEVRKKAHLYRIWMSIERKLFSSASAILVTNEKFKDYYLKKGIKNVVVLPSCVDLNENDHQEISQSRARSQENLRLVYTGSVYEANEDTILCFLEAAKKVNNVEIIFATPYRKDYLEKVSIGFLSKKECSKLQRNADVLFLPLSFKSPYPEEIKCAFPCKVLEYLAAGKPILAIVPRGSFMEDFIRGNEVGIAVTEPSSEKIAETIEVLKDKEKRRRYGRNALRTVVLFDARKQAKRLCSIIEHVVSDNFSKPNTLNISRK